MGGTRGRAPVAVRIATDHSYTEILSVRLDLSFGRYFPSLSRGALKISLSRNPPFCLSTQFNNIKRIIGPHLKFRRALCINATAVLDKITIDDKV